MRRRSWLRMNLPVALVIALLLHLLLFLAVELIPGLRAAWNPTIPARTPEPEPLRFTFVDLPAEPPEPREPPEEALASDRTRRAAGELPPEALPPSPDPFSEGNTDQRVESAPSAEPSPRREAPDEAARAEPEAATAEPAPEPRPVEPEGISPDAAESADAETARKLAGLQQAVRPFSVRDLGQRFDNLGSASEMEFGPISFNTVGVDWGPYARKIVEIIRERWFERIPQAARMGLAGRSVISFRIARDGSISAIVLQESSGYRPLDKAAEFAVEAADLPPLPPEFLRLDKEYEEVTFSFYYNMRVPRE